MENLTYEKKKVLHPVCPCEETLIMIEIFLALEKTDKSDSTWVIWLLRIRKQTGLFAGKEWGLLVHTQEYESDNSDLLLSLRMSVSFMYVHAEHPPLEAAGCWCIISLYAHKHAYTKHCCKLSISLVSLRPPVLTDSWWTGYDIHPHPHWDCRKPLFQNYIHLL